MMRPVDIAMQDLEELNAYMNGIQKTPSTLTDDENASLIKYLYTLNTALNTHLVRNTSLLFILEIHTDFLFEIISMC